MERLSQIGSHSWFLVLASSVLLIGCSSRSGSEWTVDRGALRLTETLRVSAGADFYLGEVYDVAVRDDGRIYVADGEAGNVKVLASDGTLQGTIGRQGQGPGEFERAPTQVTLARGDSLYVLDSYSGQMSVFAPDHSFVRRFSVRPGVPLKFFVPEERRGFWGVYSNGAGADEPRREVVRRLGPSGTAGDTLLTSPRQPSSGVPFSRSPVFAFGPQGRVHYAWNDSLTVTPYTLDGEARPSVRVPFEPVPVTEDDRSRRMKRIRVQQGESRAAIREKIPETKPAVDRLLIDDQGRYWFGRPTAHPDSTAWWVADPDEKRVATTTLPSKLVRPGGVLILTVQNGSVYARTTTKNGAPALVRYRVRVTP